MSWQVGQERWFIVDRDVPAPEFTPLYRYLPVDYRWDDRGLPGNWCRVSYESIGDMVVAIISVPRHCWSISLDSVNEQLDKDIPQSGEYSTLKVRKWRARRDSNSRPPGS